MPTINTDALAGALANHARDGRVLVIESGRDCDGTQYSGRVHEIDATAAAYWALHDRIAEWADGPFSLRVAPLDEPVQYVSRDLGLEAFENGHPHLITTGA